MLPAALLLKRSEWVSFVGQSFAIGALSMSLIACLPPVVPLDLWLYAFLLLAFVSAAATFYLLLSRRFFIYATTRLFYVAAAAACLLPLLIVVLGPNVGWDAVNYYFLTAVDYSVRNRVDLFYGQAVTLSTHAPIPLFPLVIVQYATAVDLASLLHTTADASVRLLPFGFLIGTLSGLLRIARSLVPRALLFLVPLVLVCTPIMIDYWYEYVYYVDLPTAMFAFLALAEVLVIRKTRAPMAWVRLGLWCSGLLLTKVTGPAILLMVAVPLIIAVTRKRAVWYATALVAAALFVAGGLVVGGMSLTSQPWRWVGAAFALVMLLAIVPSLGGAAIRSWSWGNFAGLLLALMPGCAFLVRHSLAQGSPFGYYASSLLQNRSATLRWALTILRKNAPDAWLSQPGNPDNFPLAPILGWSFAPPMSFLSTAALVRFRFSFPLTVVGAFVLLYYLAFDTVFQLVDLRELMVIAPLVAVLAITFLARVLPRGATIAVFFAASVLSLPFAWVPQQGENRAVDDLVHALGLFGWTGSSNQTLEFDLWYASAVLIVLAVVAAACRRRTFTAIRPAVAASAVIGIVLCTSFAPFLSNIADAHHQRTTTQVETYHQGYIPVLERLLQTPGHFVVLTYYGYGFEWFSVGRIRRIELTGATDLASIAPYLRRGEKALRRHLEAENVRYVVVPVPGSPYYPEYRKLLRTREMSSLRTMLQHSPSRPVNGWRIYAVSAQRVSTTRKRSRMPAIASFRFSATTLDTRSITAA